MELLLNLAWLLLALPAYQLWRGSRVAGRRRRFGSLQCLLALGCVLVMLFPVVSATDDLHAMRAEIEESPASKRSVRHSASDKGSAWNGRLQNPPALLATGFSFFPTVEFRQQTALPSSCLFTPSSAPHFGRAPPAILS
jgi:hypothetical protein